ncbi:hypothetical protein NLJ89_g2815 [Agrocybe chaxingu]|uniref:Uncharacterized protein n=1 Tax=Agrocybe chaxingu TaxID=84603 RepID=A0A9W8K567_9AGAR|nr:hypothetical protein NLJ89_g2815 [Agrocybe chaxingu]
MASSFSQEALSDLDMNHPTRQAKYLPRTDAIRNHGSAAGTRRRCDSPASPGKQPQVYPAPSVKRQREEPCEDVAVVETAPSMDSTAATDTSSNDTIRLTKRHCLETEAEFALEEANWVAEVFEADNSGTRDDQGDTTDPGSDGNAKGPTAPQPSTSSTSSNRSLPAITNADPVATPA